MVFPELTAFEAEAEGVESSLAAVPDDAWSRPALGQWNVAELVAHLCRGADRIAAYLDEPVDAAEPACDRISYWRFDLAEAAAGIAHRARDEASGVRPEQLVDRFASRWRVSAQRAAAAGAARLLHTFRGPMRLDDYTATRVLELVVHHVDLRAALDLPPATDPAAGRLTAEILEGLLDGPRPRAMGRHRFILAATGRIDSDDPRLPVIR